MKSVGSCQLPYGRRRRFPRSSRTSTATDTTTSSCRLSTRRRHAVRSHRCGRCRYRPEAGRLLARRGGNGATRGKKPQRTALLLTVTSDWHGRQFGSSATRGARISISASPRVSGPAAVDDIDGDGAQELVVVADVVHWARAVRRRPWDIASGTQRWMIPGIGGSDVLLEQLDADPALEIVLAGVPGYVLDGATQAIDLDVQGRLRRVPRRQPFQRRQRRAIRGRARRWDLFTVFQARRIRRSGMRAFSTSTRSRPRIWTATTS